MTLKKRYQYPLYILSHPTDGYEELCEKDKWSKSFALLVLTAWFIADVGRLCWCDSRRGLSSAEGSLARDFLPIACRYCSHCRADFLLLLNQNSL